MGATTWDGASSPSLNEMSGKVLVAVITILVMVIIFVLLVHIYARWFWSRHGGAEIHRLRRPRSRFVFAPTEEPLQRGLEPSVLHALPIAIFKQEDFKEGLECAVCLCELEDGEQARVIPKCNHGFHVQCIDMWFQSHSTCPLCRITVGGQLDDVNSGSDGVHSIELPNFPTNVLIWENGSSVSAGNITSSAPQSPGSLTIDIPTRLLDGFSSRSPSATKALFV